MITSEIIDIIQNLPLKNFDLLSVGITIAAIAILGFVTYINNPKSITNKTFLLFAIITILFSFFNYINYQTTKPEVVLWLLRIVIFISVWHAYSIFQFFYVYPEESKKFPKWYVYLLIPWVFTVSILTLTPNVFSGIAQLSADGSVSKTIVQKGIILFVLTVIGLILGGLVIFWRKLRKESGVNKIQYKLILVGTICTFALLLTFNLILPGIFLNVRFIPLGALFMFPFVAFTSYAVYKHHLFNVRTAAIAALTFVLCAVTFLEIIFSDTLSLILLRSGIFVVVLMVSILMNRFAGTIAEQREALEVANKGQENLIHIMNHQIKAYLSKSKNIFAELLTDDYGVVPEEAKPIIKEGFDSLSEGVNFVQQVLKGSSAQSGRLAYNMTQFDIKDLLTVVADQKKEMALKKNLSYEVTIDEGNYRITGDELQLKEVIQNLIDNSILYTPAGSITIHLARKTASVVLTVTDTGAGITPEDRPRLFTKGGRGKDSLRMNVNSTGYGLSFVKGVIDAHSGKVSAESAGKGKGSTFIVELPIEQSPTSKET